MGAYISCYTGHAVDFSVRYNAASGGGVTAVLKYGLDHGIVSGTVVTKMHEKYPLLPAPFVARTGDGLAVAQGSKYCPVPVGIALKEILNQDGRYAVVGLPCHIHGLRKAELVNRKLRDRVVLHLSLFCGRCINLLGTEFLLKEFQIPLQNVTQIKYRGEGWPGFLTVEYGPRARRLIPYTEYGAKFTFSNGFCPTRCMLCPDGTGELADLSFGDAWLPEFRETDSIGRSLVIARTQNGEKLLRAAVDKGYFRASPIPMSRAEMSQSSLLQWHKQWLKARYGMLQSCGISVPAYDFMPSASGFDGYLDALKLLMLSRLAARRSMWVPLQKFDMTMKWPLKLRLKNLRRVLAVVSKRTTNC
jgi:coenzyme F420 hydrogenase subunit beta